jgi:hypothetical protein
MTEEGLKMNFDGTASLPSFWRQILNKYPGPAETALKCIFHASMFLCKIRILYHECYQNTTGLDTHYPLAVFLSAYSRQV